MHADLFAGEGGFTPRPAWQVIEAARRQLLTGELSLATTPTTHVYLRDGQIYFAERSTDGGLGVRLLVEGVITRQQMGKGALLVSGVEHLGRMFQRDATIDRQSVELCVELMTDDVLTSMANDVIDHYTMTMYKRHPNGIDRWLPTRIEVITHIVDGGHLAEPDAVITTGDAPRPRADVVARAANGQPVNGHAHHVQPAAACRETHETHGAADAHHEPATKAPEPDRPPANFSSHDRPSPPVVEQPVVEQPVVEQPVVEQPVVQQPVAPPSASIGSNLAAAATAGLLHSPVPVDAESLFADPPLPSEPGISLAQSAVDALMSTAIADEVAEAVRRALAAVDAMGSAPTGV